MQKIILGKQVKELDALYINESGISSYQLMERAANEFCHWFEAKYKKASTVNIYCGTGNNGGDGLAIARILSGLGYQVNVAVMGNQEKGTVDFTKNLKVLPEKLRVSSWSQLKPSDICIDAIFGVGINRPLEGEYEDLVQMLNNRDGVKISVDMPSGLPSDAPAEGEVFHADYTVSFQFPKLALLFPEHAAYVGQLVVRKIGMEPKHFKPFSSKYWFFSGENMAAYHRKFHVFSHKGDFGRIILAGGSYGKMGSICLSTMAALRTGSGLVFCKVPGCGVAIVQSTIPEAMVLPPSSEMDIDADLDFTGIDAIGLGPGLGKGKNAHKLVYHVLENYSGPTVLDADAINILGEKQEWISLLHPNVILTPHLKEFERLTGKACDNHLERINLARDFCQKNNCSLVLKGAFSLLTFPDGSQIFNNSGTVYMATGGSGDVLTGVITSFLGQGYSMKNAAICGVFHHGHAGELAGEKNGRGTLPTDIIHRIPQSLLAFGIK
ncbi:NAD(P)H-hydrate dehydratase [Cyclobacterium sp. 1_MG-2023]|uniref:NAD(P)H-hydrate dehydratase n=1 Tax=Cyclobacterium sp. 1_MG-2023 TaxID=3062681 RepID=UPI0026E412A4|nr:NAD(P)H-hydrate dehydratase [Cyclobacterium sp. 1_MG-2023]MDO6437363.1 NAD(P)H-hydrate dehydratase [Cyclobacterium sp. 1_MG-2023]